MDPDQTAPKGSDKGSWCLLLKKGSLEADTYQRYFQNKNGHIRVFLKATMS